MHLLARLVVATSVAFVLLGFCSAPARAQAVPVWLPGLSVTLFIRLIEFRELALEEIRERLDRYPITYPRFLPPPVPVILPVIDPGLDPAPLRAAAARSPLEEVLVP